MGYEDKVDLVFISVYFIEQTALILSYILLPLFMNIWISIFPVIFLSTMAIEKVLIKADFKKKMGIDEKEKEKSRDEGLEETKINYFKKK